MKKNTWCLTLAGMLVLSVALSGCEMLFPPITYQETATKITYDISYGYRIRSTGKGLYEITYLCDTPQVLRGTITYDLLYKDDYEIRTMFNNTVIHWNVSERDGTTFELGVTASVEAASYLVADLNGKDALTIQEIKEEHPEISDQYTRLQANETTRFIDPDDPAIISIASMVFLNAQTNNSFALAKSLFSWLKKNIQYQTHPDEIAVRPAAVTLQSKQGDCDDLSFLYISLCRALDIPARFIRGYLLTETTNGAVIATAHAWVEVFVGGPGSHHGWIPIECACCSSSIDIDIHQNFGVESACHLRLFTDDGSNESLETSLTGIMYVSRDPSLSITLESFAEIQNYQVLESRKLIITDNNMRYYD
jgi:transglutaminase-like putative cysteine protease